jgi:hypothetical protein
LTDQCIVTEHIIRYDATAAPQPWEAGSEELAAVIVLGAVLVLAFVPLGAGKLTLAFTITPLIY